jgi:hypothetical protein
MLIFVGETYLSEAVRFKVNWAGEFRDAWRRGSPLLDSEEKAGQDKFKIPFESFSRHARTARASA